MVTIVSLGESLGLIFQIGYSIHVSRALGWLITQGFVILPASLNVDIATKNKHDVDIREPGAFFAWGAEILLAVAKMFSGCNTAVIIGSAAVFLEEQAKGRQRHTDEYYPKQWIQMQIIMPNPEYCTHFWCSLCCVIVCDLLCWELEVCQSIISVFRIVLSEIWKVSKYTRLLHFSSLWYWVWLMVLTVEFDWMLDWLL